MFICTVGVLFQSDHNILFCCSESMVLQPDVEEGREKAKIQMKI